jgi:hypothetical protein
MQIPRALAVALLPLCALLAGCSSSGDSGAGFTVKAPAEPGGAYTFTAGAAADNYTWDLGDHLSVAFGKSVVHTYDFRDGTLTVTLKSKAGAQTREYNQQLVLGSGKNQKATFLMEAQTDWAVVGETVTFSASRSFDPEGDPLRFSWSCLKTGPAERKPAHTHPVIGQPFASPPAGSVTTGKANRTLPAADVTFPGDLCDALGPGTPLSTKATTIAGHFASTGVYSIYLLAADPAHPTTSGEFKLYVTPPGDRPNPIVTLHMEGTLVAGSSGTLQNACGNAQNPMPQSCDLATGSFGLALGGLVLMANMTFGPQSPFQDPAGLDKLAWEIKRGDSAVATGTGVSPEHAVVHEAAKLGAGEYTVSIKLTQGAQVSYTFDVYVHLDMDPAKVY